MPFATRYPPDTLAPDIYATLRKMQKFMVVKKYNVDRSEIPPEPAKVKMSGYLKKKRSKMGGWRKMWFVLQNHLLLSYPTKEEYDKGLGTFKDVLNLVPGTQIRPLGGFRFTLETTTNTIYTFRCDDSKTCTEWITALLESLAIKPDPKPKETIVEKIPKFHTSLNDISEVERTETIRTSASCDSIYQVKNDTLSPKSPKILIAQNTARILEKNGVATKKMNKLQQIEEEAESPKRARNFRLHERSYSVNQSDEVSRINQMFHRSISTSALNHRRTGSDSRSGGSRSSSSASSPFEEPMTRSQVISNTLLVKQLQEHYTRMRHANDVNATNTASSENNSVNSEKRYKCKHCTSKGHKRDYNQNNMIADCERTLEDDVQRLSLNDKSAYDPTVLHNGDTTNILKDPAMSSPRRRRRQCTNHSPLHHHQQHHCRRHHHDGIEAGMDGDAGVDTDNEDIGYGDGGGLVVANKDGRDLRMSATPRLSLSSDNVNRLEPIYAVVDLKNKYAHRAKMRQLEEQIERERPKSVHVVSSDYEEVLNFSHESEEDDDSENIYEPINIPETIQQRPTVWKYFPKFNIETLMEMARTRKKVAPGPEQFGSQQNNGSYNGLNPSHFAYPLQPHQLSTNAHNNNNNHPPHHSTTFSDIRKKFGYHRKSIKNRMRRFYWKDSSTTSSSTLSSSAGHSRFFLPPRKNERNAYSDDELDSQGATVSNSETSEGSFKLQFDHSRKESEENANSRPKNNNNGNGGQPKADKASYVLNEIEKYRRGERHFFGSLSRLKKTRTSLCLDDDDTNSTKKKLLALAAPKSSPCFQNELRNEILRRSGRKLDN